MDAENWPLFFRAHHLGFGDVPLRLTDVVGDGEASLRQGKGSSRAALVSKDAGASFRSTFSNPC